MRTMLLVVFLALLGCHCVTSVSCPSETVLVKVPATGRLVCVDKYENYVVEVEGNNERVHAFNYPLEAGKVYKAVVGSNVQPQAYISANQAALACNNSGKHLCLLDEWLAACRGPSNYIYPYGMDYHEGYCNEGRKVNPVNELFGPHPTWNQTEMNDPRLDLLPHTVSIVGSFKKCVSEYGAFDMSGNLDEWVDHINEGKKTGTFKGGFFVDAKINGPGCLYQTVAHAPTYHDYSLGFRCCSSPS